MSGHPTAGVDSCRGFSVGCLHVSPVAPRPKRLHQMNRLEDVGPFPGGGLNGSNDQCDGLMLAIPAYAVELFRYRGAAKDGGTLEYTL